MAKILSEETITLLTQSSTQYTSLPARKIKEIGIAGHGQYVICECSCTADVLDNGLLGWVGCDIHEYNENGELIDKPIH